MREILGLLIMIMGLLFGAYLGIWVMFIGGIMQIAHSIQPAFSAVGIAWGIVRIIFSGFVGWLTVIGSIGLGKIIAG